MQNDLRTTHPNLGIEIIGINEADHVTGCGTTSFSDGNSAITNDANAPDIPWLQDVDLDGNCASDLWDDSWSVNYRDVIILDGDNEQVGVFNLTDPAHGGTGCSLAQTSCYNALKAMFVSAASTP